MKKRLYRNKRSAASLLASGAATINIHQRAGRVKVQSTREALRNDSKAIAQDARRAYSRATRILETA